MLDSDTLKIIWNFGSTRFGLKRTISVGSLGSSPRDFGHLRKHLDPKFHEILRVPSPELWPKWELSLPSISLSWPSRLSWRLKSQFQSHSSTFSLSSVVIHPLRNTIICGCVLSLRISKKPYQLAKNGKDGFKAAHGNALRKSIDCVLHFTPWVYQKKKSLGASEIGLRKEGKENI